MPIAERGVYTVSRVYEYTARVCAVSGRVPRLMSLRGLVEIVPIFHTVLARVYHYAISELCKGLYHHNEV